MERTEQTEIGSISETQKPMKIEHKKILFCIGLYCATMFSIQAQQRRENVPAIRTDKAVLDYTTDARGNRIPDFSYCGYKASEVSIPEVAVKAVVPFQEGDATARIQAALDYVAGLEADADGFRGAVLLEAGCYELSGGLTIRNSGVVLRGSGCHDNGTELLGLGDDRTTMIRIAGKKDRQYGEMIPLSGNVPTGAMWVLAKNHSFNIGDTICVKRVGTAEWINEMDMNDFGGESDYIGWKPKHPDGRPGEVDLYWERTITGMDGDSIFVDAPLTCEMRVQYEEGFVASMTFPGRIRQSGVENLRLRSLYDENNPKDENHRWIAINIDNAEDVWVRRVEFRHFAGSAVYITETGRRITVEDCKSFAPVSEIGGQRRYTYFTLGGQCLFQRLYAEYGMHDFATGRCVPGPTAFVQCYAYRPNHFSGTVDSWATGVLFDVVYSDGHAISMANRGQDGMGAGWTAGNSMCWNCSASMIACAKPPTAYNWVYGAWGQSSGNATRVSSGSFVKPHSLYYAQLAGRLGKKHPDEAKLMPFDTQSASNPPVAVAQKFVEAARQPAMLLPEWIDTLIQREPLSCSLPSGKAYRAWEKALSVKTPAKESSQMTLQNGRLVYGDKVMTGRSQGIVWWNGSVKDRFLRGARPSITRYVPGRTGLGFTDDLNEMTDNMQRNGLVMTEHHYALWYDRRRDDHERIRRMDGYVWAPFYELPFARSGQGRAWDGLSQYDLTKWNVWYWNRLREYADLADEKGLILFHQNYFQHNIIEAGAHYADFPWRTANNINGTEMPEPVPYAGDKRVFMAENFYDIDNPARRALHRNYIRKCLDNFVGNHSVIQSVSAEYTGPLHFVQFWIDVIAEWEAETGNDVLVALSTTKDVQDAILEDPQRSKTVDVIDIQYWSPMMGGGFNAPPGGANLAPRQFQRLGAFRVEGDGKGSTQAERVYETILDYRRRYPEKAVMYSAGGDAWTCFMAGASLCGLPKALPEEFLKSVASFSVIEGDSWTLGKAGKGYVVYANKASVSLDLSRDKATYTAQWLDARSGMPVGEPFKIKGGKRIEQKGQGVLWLSK